jgi:hypothetical protein
MGNPLRSMFSAMFRPMTSSPMTPNAWPLMIVPWLVTPYPYQIPLNHGRGSILEFSGRLAISRVKNGSQAPPEHT